MMECDICHKEFKNVEAHKRMAHSISKTNDEIARILYEDVVVPLCKGRAIQIGSWEEVAKEDYLNVAKKIRG